jgi:DNA-binding NtrC family response regulator
VTTRSNPGDPSSRYPKAAPLSASFTGRSGSSEPPRHSGEHLLVVDDEASIRLSLHRFLSRRGYHVSTARNGCEALAILDAQRAVDLVVTDLMMPEFDGRELILQMREQHASVPVLVISGFPAALLPDTGPDGKPLAFLAKPFALDALGTEVRRLLDERAQRQRQDETG